MHKMYGVFQYSGESFLYNLSVDESFMTDKNERFSDTLHRVYNLKSIKITPVDITGFQSHDLPSNDSSESTDVSMISIAHLYQIVNERDKNFFSNAESPGRTEREAEKFREAEYTDSVNAVKNGADVEAVEAQKQIESYAEEKKLSATEAQSELRKNVATYITFPSESNTSTDIENVIISAFDDIISKHNFDSNQTRALRRFENFAVKNQITEKIIDTAFEQQPQFKITYQNRFGMSNRYFGGKLKLLENELERAIQEHIAANTENDSNDNLVNGSDNTATLMEVTSNNSGIYEGERNDENTVIPYIDIRNEAESLSENKDESDLPFEVGDKIYYNGQFWNVDRIDVEKDRIDLSRETGNIIMPHEKISGFLSQVLIYMQENVAAEELETEEHTEEIENSIDESSELERISAETAVRMRENDFSVYDESNNQITAYNSLEKSIQEYEAVANTLSHRLYKKFTEAFPEIADGTHSYEHYSFGENSAYEPLSIEHLYGNKYGFMTYYEQNGDLMRDPDFTFELNHENQTLIISEYQQDGVPPYGTIYQTVYDESNNFDERLENALAHNFLSVLNSAISADRPLVNYTDSNGISHELAEKAESVEAEIVEDRNAALREVLNDFSKKHDLGEVNVDSKNYSWELTEKLADGTELKLGEINTPESGQMFTPDTLKEALGKFEDSISARSAEISEIYGRKTTIAAHGGKSKLPKVHENLPTISYADKPSQRISDNIMAICELIRLEKAEQEGRPLYDKRRNSYKSKENSDSILRKYCGWGGLPQVFDERFKTYEYSRNILKDMLTPEEYAQAKASTLNAHYTSQFVIDSMYKMAMRMDIPRDSRVLEPAAGTGNFISRMPHSIGNGGVTAVELDSITARICDKLNNQNDNVTVINSGFEHVKLNSDCFDFVISNVPFGSSGEKFLDEKSYPEDGRSRNMSLHNGFIRKSIDLVAPGGVIMVITTSATMDNKNPADREIFAKYCDLEGAIRLPNTAFSEVGTGVTADILVLKKRETSREIGDKLPNWCYTAPNSDGLNINSYFVESLCS